MPAESSYFVSVPVPVNRVQEVYALLASTNGSAPPESSLPGGWTEELVERMYRESPAPMKAMLRLLASRPGAVVTAEQVATTIQRTRQQFAGVLGAYGRRVAHRYSMDQWPFRAEYSPEVRMVIYSMSVEVAEIIRRAADRS